MSNSRHPPRESNADSGHGHAAPCRRTDTDSGAVAVVAVVLLVVVTLLFGGVLLGTLGGVEGVGATVPSEPTVVRLDASTVGREVRLSHRGGGRLDVRAVRLVVTVAGDPLRHQPPVPFFAADGFRGGPTGPFNTGSDRWWAVGETASFRVASTNHPVPSPGDRVRVRLYREDLLVATAATVAQPANTRTEATTESTPS
ncbi:MAG: hypothetical protein ABEH80_02685, partial [Halobaculum sp.]